MDRTEQSIKQIENDIKDIKNSLKDLTRKIETIEKTTSKSSDTTVMNFLKGAFVIDISKTLQRIEDKITKK